MKVLSPFLDGIGELRPAECGRCGEDDDVAGLQRIHRFAVNDAEAGFLAILGSAHEMILARNCIQHPADIGTNWVHQNAEYARKYPQAHFADQFYPTLLQDEEGIAPPAPLEITREKIEKAMNEVEHLGELLDNKLREVQGYF